jgi:hypothetical protein
MLKLVGKLRRKYIGFLIILCYINVIDYRHRLNTRYQMIFYKSNHFSACPKMFALFFYIIPRGKGG